jgi:hypothetical protein
MSPVYGPNEYEEKLNNRKSELSMRFAREGKLLAQDILDKTIENVHLASVSVQVSSSSDHAEVIDSAIGMLRESGWTVETFKPWHEGFVNLFRDEKILRRLNVSSASGQRQFTVKLRCY